MAHREGIDDELVQGSPKAGDEVFQDGASIGVRGQAVADDPLERLGKTGATRVGVGQAAADLILQAGELHTREWRGACDQVKERRGQAVDVERGRHPAISASGAR